MTLIGGVQKYWHDANGNATRHLDGSQDVTLTYDAENRLTAMTGSVTASYVYDGSRVKETIGPVFATNYTNCHERSLKFVQISGIRGRESRADSCHELHELTRRQKLDSCKLVKFVAEKAGRILATNCTN